MTYRNPAPTVDIIIELRDRPHRPIVLIERKFAPLGWAIPGGFVDYGERVEDAAHREAEEETSLKVTLKRLLQVYSDPTRDNRKHTMSLVYIAEAEGTPLAADDAKTLKVFEPWEIPKNLCFDHDQIMEDYLNLRHYGIHPPIH